ncbi:Zinc finger protein 729 [Eumeta japonica]|uniref:Zinc finger protein 729 n=1 Tax=Eumeta variegata TaxID=151549 RepID=A0A4C1UUL1_EUMVA|nr:Zinc finger protein 729 [Eumeta japonica]
MVEKAFTWTTRLATTFFQLRLENDWLFKKKPQAWKDFRNILLEHGFPEEMTLDHMRKKWMYTYDRKHRIVLKRGMEANDWPLYIPLLQYYENFDTNTLIKLNKQGCTFPYVRYPKGKGKKALQDNAGRSDNENGEFQWTRDITETFIQIRLQHEWMFRERKWAWKEVEKKLRSSGIPLDHTLLELPEMWVHLTKTYKWKQKFAAKGMLNEVWPYYEAMAKYYKVKNQIQISCKREYNTGINTEDTNDFNDDDYEDDIKLFDLKQRTGQNNARRSSSCRTCDQEEGSVNLFEQHDEDGCDLAHMLKIICGVEALQSDNLPKQMCFNCFKQLENAYKFRRKCQEVDKNFKSRNRNVIQIKIEAIDNENSQAGLLKSAKIEKTIDTSTIFSEFDTTDFDDAQSFEETANGKPSPLTIAKPKARRSIMKKERKKYDYARMCEICGKKTKNMKSHMDTHAEGKFYKCDQCDKRFKFKSGLVIHKSSHNPTPRKTCEVCGKAFHILSSYRKHFVYHANERKYSCETCGKCFNTKDILTVHMRMHTDERPFSCPECGKNFRTAGCVSRHKKIVHKTTAKAPESKGFKDQDQKRERD